MSKFLPSKNTVSLCHKDDCTHFSGKNAEMVTTGVVATLLFVGIASIIDALR